MKDKMILRGPDGTEYPVGEGQALAIGDPGDDGKQRAEVVDIVEHEGAKAVVSEEVRKMLHDQVELVRSGTADQANLMKSLQDILAMNQSQNRQAPVNGGAFAAVSDSLDAKTYEELIDRPATNDWTEEVQRLHDRAYLRYQARVAIARCKELPAPRFEDTHEGKQWRSVVQSGPWPIDDAGLKRAQRTFEMTTRAAGDVWAPSDTTQGGNWAPTGVSRQFIDGHRLQTDLVSAFPRVEIPRGVQQLNIPTLTGTATVTISSAITGATAADFDPQSTVAPITPSTGVMVLKAAKHATSPMGANVEEIEDATLAVIDVLVAEGFAAMAKAQESAILNGDIVTSGVDTTLGPAPANGYASAADVGVGLRPYAINNSHLSDFGGGNLTKSGVLGLLRTMGKFAINDGSNNVAVVLSPKCWFDLLDDPHMTSMDIVGSLATLPTGALTRIFNAAIYVSNEMPDVLSTSAKVTGSNDSTWCQGVNLNRWRVGASRSAEVRILGAALTDAVLLRHFARHAIGHAPPLTDATTVTAYNIDNTA